MTHSHPIGVHPVHDGIYRVDGLDSCTVVADIGAFAVAHTPNANIFLVTRSVQYAMEPYRGGFLVTDGHHNRVYRVTLDGTVSEFITFGNVVPTGLQVLGNTIYMAEAGHAPHHPEDGKVVAFSQGSSTATVVASGARLLVDVERGRGNTLFALSQGDFPACNEALRPVRCDGRHTRATQHRIAPEGQQRRNPHGGRGHGGARPANLARDHRHDRIRDHARRRDLEDRQHLRAELRALKPLGLPLARFEEAEAALKRPRQTVDAIEAAEAAQEKGRAMKVITPTRIATVLGTLAFLAGALATTATAEPGNPATEAAIAAQRLSVTATDERSPDTKDAAILSSEPAAIAGRSTSATAADKRSPDTRDVTRVNAAPTPTPQVAIVANSTVFDWTDAAIGAFAGFAISLLLWGMIVLSHRGRHGSLAV